MADRLCRLDFVVLDEFCYLPFCFCPSPKPAVSSSTSISSASHAMPRRLYRTAPGGGASCVVEVSFRRSAASVIRSWPDIEQRERDIYTGGRRPFGYSIVGDDTPDDKGRKPERHLVPLPEELAAIDEMRGIRAGGGSLRSIAEVMSAGVSVVAHWRAKEPGRLGGSAGGLGQGSRLR